MGKFTPTSETVKQEVLEYAIKELSNDDLINELKSRGCQTGLLFNLTDVDMQLESLNEIRDEDDQIVLDEMEKENIMNEVFNDLDSVISRINSDIQDKILEYYD